MDHKKKPWPENVTYWNIITDTTAVLAITQSETLLKESVVAAQAIRDRTDKILGMLVPLVTALMVYITSGISKWSDIIHLTALCFLIVIIIALSLMFRNLTPYEISVPGNHAESFINNDYIDAEEIKEQNIKIALKISSDNKLRRDKNDLANKISAARNKKALFVLVIGLPSCPLLALISHLLF